MPRQPATAGDAVAEVPRGLGTDASSPAGSGPGDHPAPEGADGARARNRPCAKALAPPWTRRRAKAAVAADPFWFAVDRPQNVVDEHTRQFVFKLTPGSWILALEDRGTSFLVQDSHGKTGVLLDLVGIERAPEGY